MLYNFAGLVVEIEFKHDFGAKLCENYIYNGEKKPDFSVVMTDEMIEEERRIEENIGSFNDAYLESVAAYRKICDIAYDYDCMFMHCSAISYKGNAILFTAPSGTGKSTHSRLWKKHFGDDVDMINDDKPLLRIIDGKIYACGTPWDGKHHLSNNVMLPVKAIVVLSQSRENVIGKASKQELLYHILNQTIRPENPVLMNKALAFIEKMIRAIPAYKLGCNISDEAVTTCFEAVKENFNED